MNNKKVFVGTYEEVPYWTRWGRYFWIRLLGGSSRLCNMSIGCRKATKMFLSATDAMRWLVHDCYGEGDKVSSILVVAGQNDHEGLGAEPGVKSLSFLGGFLEDFEC